MALIDFLMEHTTMVVVSMVLFSLFVGFALLRYAGKASKKYTQKFLDGTMEQELSASLRQSAPQQFNQTILDGMVVWSRGLRPYLQDDFKGYEEAVKEYNQFSSVMGGVLVAGAEWRYYQKGRFFHGLILCRSGPDTILLRMDGPTHRVSLNGFNVGSLDIEELRVGFKGFPDGVIRMPKGLTFLGSEDIIWDVLVRERKVASITYWAKTLQRPGNSEKLLEFFEPGLSREQKAVLLGLALYARLQKVVGSASHK